MFEILDFMREAIKLKDTVRSGWVLKKVKDPESVADHTFSLALLSMIFGKKMNLNVEKCIKIALIHDIGEVYTGDIVTRFREEDQPVSNEGKKHLSDESTKKLIFTLPTEFRKEFSELWEEYHNKNSKEANLVKELDSLDSSIQLLEYKNRTKVGLLSEHLETADRQIKSPEIRKLFEEIRRRIEEK